MKKILLFLGVIAIISSCNKEGPQGPAGAKGAAGQNAAVNCSECHNNSAPVGMDLSIVAAQDQYSNSGHWIIWNSSSYNTSWPGTGCARCHTNEGFNECATTGTLDSANITAAILNPTPQSCYTCHWVHRSYDSTDLQLKTTAPVTMLMDESTVINLSGATAGVTGSGGSLGSGSYGNLCASCHQPRPLTASTVTDVTTKKVLTASSSNSDSVYIYSSRFGPHDSPQAALLAGKALFPVAGTASYTNHPHSGAPNGCIACHMANPVGLYAGGHSLNVAYTNPIVFPFSPTTPGTAINVNGCLQCHIGLTAAQALTNVNASQATTQALLTQLQNTLVANKWLSSTTGLVNATTSKPLKITSIQAKAIYNYYFVLNDGTIGVHNPTYAQALLTNSIAAIQ